MKLLRRFLFTFTAGFSIIVMIWCDRTISMWSFYAPRFISICIRGRRNVGCIIHAVANTIGIGCTGRLEFSLGIVISTRLKISVSIIYTCLFHEADLSLKSEKKTILKFGSYILLKTNIWKFLQSWLIAKALVSLPISRMCSMYPRVESRVISKGWVQSWYLLPAPERSLNPTQLSSLEHLSFAMPISENSCLFPFLLQYLLGIREYVSNKIIAMLR